jgi:hypothetical protein
MKIMHSYPKERKCKGLGREEGAEVGDMEEFGVKVAVLDGDI